MEPPLKAMKTSEVALASERQNVEQQLVAAPFLELEKDAPETNSNKSVARVSFNVPDTSINLLPTGSLNLLKPLSEGSVQHLLAGARANVGVLAGRYMFEVQVVEKPYLPQGKRATLRVGFSTDSSSELLLANAESTVCLQVDSTSLKQGTVLAVMLNLDRESSNYSSVSLFKDGVRACEPQLLPKSLEGKALFPAVTFKMMTLQVNFGPDALAPLPFKCRMLEGADEADVRVLGSPRPPRDGRYEVVYPVGLPGEGPFDWLDCFLQRNPNYVELSERAVAVWAESSGLQRRMQGTKASIDKPDVFFGMEDGSAMRLLISAAALQPRHYVVMELQRNLVKEERAKLLQRFPIGMFKQVAKVLVGEPSVEFRQFIQEFILREKQAAADRLFKANKAIERMRKQAEKRKRDLERAKLKVEMERQKALTVANIKEEVVEAKAELVAKASTIARSGVPENSSRKDENGAEGVPINVEDSEAKEIEEVKMEAKEGEATGEVKIIELTADDDDQDMEVDGGDESPPKVELDSTEKAVKFRTSTLQDMTASALGANLTKFSLPSKEEGFHAIEYLWSERSDVDNYMRSWILERKLTLPVEDLIPSPWFQEHWAKWQKSLATWSSKHMEFKTTLDKKEAERQARSAKKAMFMAKARARAAKQEAERTSKAYEESERKEGAEVGEEVNSLVNENESERENLNLEEEKEEIDDKEPKEEVDAVDFDNLDVFGVSDICDLGGGIPLFKEFTSEDWTMLSMRFELHLLIVAFRRDIGDPERTSIFIPNVGFYYQKYYKKSLDLRTFGVDSFEALVRLFPDTIYTNGQAMESLVPESLEEFDIFVKVGEEDRRQRSLLIDSGDESARLNLSFGLKNVGLTDWPNKGGGKWQNESKGESARSLGKGEGKGCAPVPHVVAAKFAKADVGNYGKATKDWTACAPRKGGAVVVPAPVRNGGMLGPYCGK